MASAYRYNGSPNYTNLDQHDNLLIHERLVQSSSKDTCFIAENILIKLKITFIFFVDVLQMLVAQVV